MRQDWNTGWITARDKAEEEEEGGDEGMRGGVKYLQSFHVNIM